MFTVEMLPASYGDCLWIEYGDRQNPYRVLIDGGVASTYDALCRRIREAGANCEFELLVITHVDADHIEGVVKLLANLPPGAHFREVWFNGWDHLPGARDSRLGAPQGEKLTACIVDGGHPWNTRFNADAVAVPERGPLPEFTLDGGLKLTLLSPTAEELRKLVPKWVGECRKAGLMPGDLEDAREALERDRRIGPRRLGPPNVARLAEEEYEADSAEANGSSIAFLAEHGGTACVFAADAFSEVLVSSIRSLLRARQLEVLPLGAYKVSHHGSRYNNSPELFRLIDAQQYLFSTNGDRFEHPDPQTIARILKDRRDRRLRRKPTLAFNYSSPETSPWNSTGLRDDWNYRTLYAGAGGGVKVPL